MVRGAVIGLGVLLVAAGCAAEPLARFEPRPSRFESAHAVAVTGERFALFTDDAVIVVTSASDERCPGRLQPWGPAVWATSADGSVVARGTRSGRIEVADRRTGARATLVEGGPPEPFWFSGFRMPPVFPVAVARDGSRIAYAMKPTICVLAWPSCETVARFDVPGSCEQLAFSPDAAMLAYSVSADSRSPAEVSILDLASGRRVLHHSSGFKWHCPWPLVFSADGRTLACGPSTLFDVGSGEAGKKLEDLKDGEAPSRRVPLPAGVEGSFVFLRDGTIVIGGENGAIQFIEPILGGEMRTIHTVDEGVAPVAFSADEKLLLAGRALYDVETGRIVRLLVEPSSAIESLEYRGDDLVVHHRGAGAVVRRRSTGALVRIEPYVSEARLDRTRVTSPDGRLVTRELSYMDYGVFDAKSGKRLWHEEITWGGLAFAFTRDSKRLAVSSSPGELRVHDARTGETLATIRESVGWDRDREISALSFSPDGKELACGLADGSIEIYAVPPSP